MKLRDVCTERGIVLIFDEVFMGFRLALGGAQEYFGVRADMVTYGKTLGGGLPVGAYGGRRDIMQMMAPAGPVYQAGTLSGNPLAMTAGIETIKVLKEPGVYHQLEEKAVLLEQGIAEAASKLGIKLQISRAGSLLTVFLTRFPVTDYEAAKRSDRDLFARFHHSLLLEGIYWPPSQFEAAFVSLAHTDRDIQATVSAAAKALAGLKE